MHKILYMYIKYRMERLSVVCVHVCVCVCVCVWYVHSVCMCIPTRDRTRNINKEWEEVGSELLNLECHKASRPGTT